jgi:hypothetical protein
VMCHIALVINYLGMQDAPWKQQHPLWKPGVWNGCLVETKKVAFFKKYHRSDGIRLILSSVISWMMLSSLSLYISRSWGAIKGCMCVSNL